MPKLTVKIIGYGVIGHYMENELQSNEIEIFIHDPDKGFVTDRQCDFGIVCVPTELISNRCDTSIVEKVVSENNDKMIIIKSTVPPGTTGYLSEKYSKHIIFSPEYYGATRHADSINKDFVILGGKKEYTSRAAELFKKVMTGFDRIIQTDSKTAELTKYIKNSFLACKVVFCNEFYRIAKSMGINYNEVRELWLMDNRVNPSHTLVFEDQPYYDSHCLNKDIPAIINACKEYNPLFLKSVQRHNERFKGEVNANI